MTHFHYARELVAADGTWRLVFAGELDLHASPQVDAWVARAIAAGALRVELDLTETTFIDSTALSALLRAQRDLSACGIALEVFCYEPNVLRIFELTELDEILPIQQARPPLVALS